MSVYTYISKAIGLDKHQVLRFPSMQEAKDLEATVCDDMNVFRKVFMYHRFLLSGVCQEEYEIQDILYLAYLRGEKFWKSKLI